MASKALKQTLVELPASLSAEAKALATKIREKSIGIPSVDEWRHHAGEHLDKSTNDAVCRQHISWFFGSVALNPSVLAILPAEIINWLLTATDLTGGEEFKFGDPYTASMSTMDRTITDVVMAFDFDDFIGSITFEGFNRDAIRRSAVAKIGIEGAVMLALIGCLRTVNLNRIADVKVLRRKYLGLDFILESVPISKLKEEGVLVEKAAGKEADVLSVARIAASFPLEVAYCSFKSNKSVKRFDTVDTPAWLQFTSAASLDLPGMHQMGWFFQKAFSKAVKGTSSVNMYKGIRRSLVTENEHNKEMFRTVYNGWIGTTSKNSCTFDQAKSGTATDDNYWKSLSKGNGEFIRRDMAGMKVPEFNEATGKFKDLPAAVVEEDDS